jgi:23S rRNA (adenine2503-C2)-methyltransferase
MCNLGCKFCHTKEYIGKIKTDNISESDIYMGVEYIINDLSIATRNGVLLVSFMGCGEPLQNVSNVVKAMKHIKSLEGKGIDYVRFAVATSLPKNDWDDFFIMTKMISDAKLPVKLHLSLHYTIDMIRKEWMPASLDILPSLSAVDFYKRISGNAVEIHYTLIENVNDTEQDAILLSNFLKDRDINIKFLFYNKKDNMDYVASNPDKLKVFKKHLDKYSIQHEYYVPPGISVGSSCGQFLLEYYEELITNDAES